MNNAAKKRFDQLSAEINSFYDFAENEVERIARKALRRNKRLDSFTMAMGVYFFSTKESIDHNYKYNELNYFIEKCFENNIKITGLPMTFTAFGPKITDW